MKYLIQPLVFGFLLGALLGCSGSRKFTDAPVKTVDPDNETIPPPREMEENQIWDIVDMTFFYQVSKALDLNWTFGKIGQLAGISGKKQADNVNVLDEVPNSSWYTNRHFHERMTLRELARGPNTTAGPDQGGTWTITRGKFEGGTPGFTIKDPHGDVYVLKFDAFDYPEMGSSAEVISTKILYAAGYNVPQNTIEYFDPAILRIGSSVKILDHGVKRPMNEEDLKNMLLNIPRREDGKIRVLTSKFLAGKPVGIWNYKGRRKDDPNDRVDHEHRRELRGLRVISSWLNDADRRAANTLAVYVEEDGKKFIKHYLIDMGSTLGSNNKFPHGPKYGNEYLFDFRTIAASYIRLGTYRKPWMNTTEHLHPKYPSVGYFESDIFEPNRWVPTYPNPAFEKATLRDAYWGAKIVMAFTDEDIRAIVKTAKMSDPAAEEYLIKILIERRDKIGRYWFGKMNPLDKFRIASSPDGYQELLFDDLAVESGLESADGTIYRYRFFRDGKKISSIRETTATAIPILLSESENKPQGNPGEHWAVSIETKRAGKSDWSKSVKVYFLENKANQKLVIIGVERPE